MNADYDIENIGVQAIILVRKFDQVYLVIPSQYLQNVFYNLLIFSVKH